MLKKFIVTIAVMSLGIVVLVALVVRLSSTTQTKVQTSNLAGELKLATTSVANLATQIRDAVSYTYITKDIDFIKSKNEEIIGTIEQLKKEIQKLSNESFIELIDSSTTNESGENYSSILEQLNENSTKAADTGLAAVTNRIGIASSLKEIEKDKKNLSKTFRRAKGLGDISSKGYKLLRRAVFTGLYSASVKDLNFAGRALTSKSQKAFSNSEMDPNKRAELDKIFNSLTLVVNKGIQINAANSDFDIFSANIQNLVEDTEKIETLVNKSLQIQQAELVDSVEQQRIIIPILGFLTIVLGTLISVLLARRTVSEVNHVVETLSGISERIEKSAQENEEVSFNLDKNFQNQASAVQETSASTQEISAMIEKNVEVVVESSKLSDNSSIASRKGAEIVTQMKDAMNEITNSSDEISSEMQKSSNNMKEIVDIFQQISKKVTVINDIVFQTKLLSFNASVEAARAGNQGKGFSVVAEEVGNLAQLSGQSAKEINELLQSNISRVETITSQSLERIESAVAKSKDKIESGLEIANSSFEILEEISQNGKELSVRLGSIKESANEEVEGVKNIASAMETIDHSTNDASYISQTILSGSKELSTEVQTMVSEIARLRKMISGSESTKIKPQAKDAEVASETPTPPTRLTEVFPDQSQFDDDSDEKLAG